MFSFLLPFSYFFRMTSHHMMKLFYFITSLCFLIHNLEAVYVERYDITTNGALTFTGNTLGLTKFAQQNNPGTSDSVGAFITTDPNQTVNSPAGPPGPYPSEPPPSGALPAGTTLDYVQNLSQAYLDLPANSTILYAELIWGGSYGWPTPANPNPPVPIACPTPPMPSTPGDICPALDIAVTLITPLGTTHSISPDIATSQRVQTPSFTNMGNYVRSQNVTSIVQAAGAGLYTVGGIPATCSATDDTHNTAGWTLAIAYQNPQMLTSQLTIFVGCEQASTSTNQPATVSGFCVPSEGSQHSRLFVSSIEADANKTGDFMLFSPTLPFTPANALSGDNNPQTNFFCSQINTLLPIFTDPVTGKLMYVGSSQLDQRGSYGDRNGNPFTATNVIAGRQGWDVTSVIIPPSLLPGGTTTAFALGTVGPGGDDYTINSLGLQIEVSAPVITASKLVNGQTLITSAVNETIEFTITLQNIASSGSVDATNVLLQDILQPGLSLVEGTVTVNGIPVSNPDLVAGIPLGMIPELSDPVVVKYKVHIDSYPQAVDAYYNTANVLYQYFPCQQEQPINLETMSNQVEILIPPIANPDFGMTLINTPLNGPSVLNNDVGVGLHVISYTSPTTQGGTVVVNPDGTYLYSPPHNFIGKDTFTYTLEDAFGQTATALVTITVTPSSPPINFRGTIRKCQYLNKTKYSLKARWTSPSSLVEFYKIYYGNKVIGRVSANSKLVFQKCIGHHKPSENFSITAVYANGFESTHVKLRITHE